MLDMVLNHQLSIIGSKSFNGEKNIKTLYLKNQKIMPPTNWESKFGDCLGTCRKV
jgi:hypothetical protein